MLSFQVVDLNGSTMIDLKMQAELFGGRTWNFNHVMEFKMFTGNLGKHFWRP